MNKAEKSPRLLKFKISSNIASMNDKLGDFSGLTPDIIAECLKQAFGIETCGLINYMPSYINRVYEVADEEENRYIIKFYRPGRWSEDAIMDEHDLIFDCKDAEIPVVAPILTEDGSSLCSYAGYFFALFEKKSGRLFETNNSEDYLRLGRLIGRLHAVSSQTMPEYRISMKPEVWKNKLLGRLLNGSLITPGEKEDFAKIAGDILTTCSPLFESFRPIACHGDCHRGNILDRGPEGLMLIDFDDMCVAPAVQDIWMLLPDYASESAREWELVLEGYNEFFRFDETQFVLIEPLRAMRMLYYLSWSSMQLNDYNFRRAYPDWGSQAFWEKEIGDFRMQLQIIRESLI